MPELLQSLFDTSGFYPRWQCGSWSDSLGWLHVLSDVAIWSAYFAIPVILVYFVVRRRDVPFSSLFWLFGAFILACGTTHLLEAVIFWKPVYRLAGVIKLFTALVSWGTVVALVPVVPKALAMRTPEELEREIAARQKAEDALRQSNAELERRVQERTAELAQANATLRESDRREKERAAEREAILRATPTAVWIAHDPQCHRITGNAASYALLRLPEGSNATATPPEGEPNRRPWREYRNGVEVPGDELPVQMAARGTEVHGSELSLVFDDGMVKHLYGNAVPLLDSEGQVRGAIAAFMDVTQLKEAEAALREDARRKDEFLATLAHELRNPLAPIRNAVEMLRLGDSDGELIAQARALMERQVGQMVRLVDDLLDLSRISRGKVELRRGRIELAGVVHSAVETSRPLIREKAHELTISLPPEPIYLDADPTRLAQIISNLLHNAAKYTDKAGHIWLTAERQGNEAVLSVRDTGIGIPPEHLPHLFKMFSQLAPAMERSPGGLGVGLALVRGLVELHGGRIEAHSGGVGRGSEFIVRLPIAEAPMLPEPSLDGEKDKPATKRRVLIVDDNRDAADSLAVMLRLSGHETQTAYDGVEGVQAAATFLPDVVLLDIGMPRMNGYQVAEHIRQQPWGTQMVLVALTGWGQADDKQRAIDAGFHHHLTKPVEPAALEQLLAELARAR